MMMRAFGFLLHPSCFGRQTLECAVSTQHLSWTLPITAHAAKQGSHRGELPEPWTCQQGETRGSVFA